MEEPSGHWATGRRTPAPPTLYTSPGAKLGTLPHTPTQDHLHPPPVLICRTRSTHPFTHPCIITTPPLRSPAPCASRSPPSVPSYCSHVVSSGRAAVPPPPSPARERAWPPARCPAFPRNRRQCSTSAKMLYWRTRVKKRVRVPNKATEML